MTSLPSYKDIVELVKKGATLEAQEKIMELREGAIELQEENLALREQVKDLRQQLDLKGKMTFKHPYYFMEGDPKPFCAKCWEHDGKAIHLLGDGGHREFWNCPVCKEVYEPYE